MDTSERAVVKREPPRPRWPVGEKCQIVEETLKTGASVAPVALTQQAAFRVARLENGVLDHSFTPGRLGFLFLADGAIAANGSKLESGDAVRIGGLPSLSLSGSGEVLLWDVPPTIDVPG